jgi:hypothetical protein
VGGDVDGFGGLEGTAAVDGLRGSLDVAGGSANGDCGEERGVARFVAIEIEVGVVGAVEEAEQDEGQRRKSGLRFRSEGRNAAQWLARNYGGGFDFEAGLIFDEGGNLDGGHGGVVAAENLAVNGAQLLGGCEIFLFVHNVPSHADDVFGPSLCGGEHFDDVFQGLAGLADEVAGGKFAGGVPTDHSTDEDGAALRLDGAGISFRARPASGLNDFHVFTSSELPT